MIVDPRMTRRWMSTLISGMVPHGQILQKMWDYHCLFHHWMRTLQWPAALTCHLDLPLACHPLQTTPWTTASPPAPQAEPPSTATAYQWPTRTVRHRVLADQEMIDSIEGCSAKHCEEPDGPANMVLCSAVGCGLNVSHLFSWVPIGNG